jgi:flavin reductase (DIM6/NTAB) family NADH-FMN oxidoreductase RutF
MKGQRERLKEEARSHKREDIRKNMQAKIFRLLFLRLPCTIEKRIETPFSRSETMKEIKALDFITRPVDLWLNRWFLLTSGNREHHNTMTVAWGSIGAMWNLPFVQVVVRPSRFTYEFINRHDTFTLCRFPEPFREALNLLGTRSGRDGDKIRESGLTIIPSTKVEAPSFKEADLILECKKIYWQDLEPGHFLDDRIQRNYPERDYHRIFFGWILRVLASEA